ncbi:MAG: hypothetical protein NT029_13200 [Armatimonadetes bacterium]|nr:hypothetical protein [Armatimonadota bacterium]
MARTQFSATLRRMPLRGGASQLAPCAFNTEPASDPVRVALADGCLFWVANDVSGPHVLCADLARGPVRRMQGAPIADGGPYPMWPGAAWMIRPPTIADAGTLVYAGPPDLVAYTVRGLGGPLNGVVASGVLHGSDSASYAGSQGAGPTAGSELSAYRRLMGPDAPDLAVARLSQSPAVAKRLPLPIDHCSRVTILAVRRGRVFVEVSGIAPGAPNWSTSVYELLPGAEHRLRIIPTADGALRHVVDGEYIYYMARGDSSEDLRLHRTPLPPAPPSS